MGNSTHLLKIFQISSSKVDFYQYSLMETKMEMTYDRLSMIWNLLTILMNYLHP